MTPLETPEREQVCTHSVPSCINHAFYASADRIQGILSHSRRALAYALDPLSHLRRKVVGPLFANLTQSAPKAASMIVKMGSLLLTGSE